MKKRNNSKSSEEKLNRANKISKQSNKIVETFGSIESAILRVFKWFSVWFDRILFNRKFSKLIAVVLAIFLYIFFYVGEGSLLDSQIKPSIKLENIPVETYVDSEIYEVSGLPATVSATVYGDAADIQAVRNQIDYKAVVDLTGKTEGRYDIQIIPVDFSSKVSVEFSPSTVVVDIRKKVSAKFSVSYDYINVNRLDGVYALGEAQLSNTEVIVKASEQTMSTVSYIKALVDVSNRTESFDTVATLVAYNNNGERVDVDILPSTVNVHVPISSPSKTVPIVVNFIGDLPNDLAVEQVTLDHSTVEIYASDEVLSKYRNIEIDVDATRLTANTSLTQNLVLPSGVRASSINKVTMNITVGAAQEKRLENIRIMYDNNVNSYKFKLADETQAYANITLVGTEKNLQDVTEENFGRVYFDMAGITPGTHKLPVQVEGNSIYLKYVLDFSEISIEVSE